MPNLKPRFLKQLFLLSLIIVLLVFILWQLSPYLPGLMATIIFYVHLECKMEELIEKGVSPRWASGLLTMLTMLAVCAPPTVLLILIWKKMDKVMEGTWAISNAMDKLMFIVKKYIGHDFEWGLDPEVLSSYVMEGTGMLGQNILNTAIALLLMVGSLYYMLLFKADKNRRYTDYLPFSNKDIKRVAVPVRRKIRSNFIGIPVTAFTQAIVASVGFYFLGVEDVLFWSLIIGFASLVPFIGSALGFIPLFLLLLGSNNDEAAWGVLLYGIIIVSTVDNLVRMMFLKHYDNIHPLQTLIGVLVGIPLFGIVGVVIGPIVLSTLVIMQRIYRESVKIGID
ncbi:AI-2E family transporter [Cytophaga sp. FL35]|uniref:AI-2E family transporter n=1 Tax=Cytophaga sp. FL35 TaxID=1904456 RepID=UPI0016536FB7|nr:AI-2E family transporter [Cytophaga sp. FL35]MBC7000727.1 AI-2E family transporter [Cytophaga sp. FL35]